MSAGTSIGSLVDRPLGTTGDRRRRLLLHHLPLAAASAVLLSLWMTLPVFDITAYGHPDIVTRAFPQVGTRRVLAPVTKHETHAGGEQHVAHTSRSAHGANRSRTIQQLTVATGYLGVGLLAVALLLGPANLLFRRRNPVSTYLRRDVGIWAAIFSIVHVMLAPLIHVSHGSGVLATVLHFFVDEGGHALTNSFGLGNWIGLVALVIVLALLATSSDAALRRLRAGRWKRVQRLTYVLFGLVVLHAFFYGAFLRMTSPFTLLLVMSVIAVCVGQTVGVVVARTCARS